MSSWKLSSSSRNNLKGVHPDLVRLTERALELSPYDFGVSDGVRSLESQKEKLKDGSSLTMKSNHLIQEDGYSHAVDFAVYVKGNLTWEVGYYRKVIQAFFTAAIELGIQINSGGLWRTLVDAPHIELSRIYRGEKL